jgi:14-3-3 protein epsilon
MKLAASLDKSLGFSTAENALFRLAHGKVFGQLRRYWRVASSLEARQKDSDAPELRLIQDQRRKIEAEMRKMSEELFELIDGQLIPYAATAESKLLYSQMHASTFESPVSGSDRSLTRSAGRRIVIKISPTFPPTRYPA